MSRFFYIIRASWDGHYQQDYWIEENNILSKITKVDFL